MENNLTTLYIYEKITIKIVNSIFVEKNNGKYI